MSTESKLSPKNLPEASYREGAERILSEAASKEFVFAVVGHVGSGTSEVAEALDSALKELGFDSHVLKASEEIREWQKKVGEESLALGKIDHAFRMQDAGDTIRLNKNDNSAIARSLIKRIRAVRAQSQRQVATSGELVEPDGNKRAYILDSLRHPEEVRLLRAIYHDAFVLVGVVCEADERRARLTKKFDDAGTRKVQEFMARDADGDLPNGQLVAETFYLSDFFVDNSEPRFLVTGDAKKTNSKWLVLEDLSRLVDIVTHEKVVRPNLSETAMYHAHGARMRSSCLSRQVGAALIDAAGDLVSTGCNEVPKAGGGVYTGEAGIDYRCAFHHRYCSSVREQNRIILEIIGAFPELQGKNEEMIKRLRKSPIGGLLEFSRAVHAEMDALISAARKGMSTVGSKLFVTTYPCHYCARHIVAAGVDEVQYIEPYPKSLATKLHDDAISTKGGGLSPSVIALREKTQKSVPEKAEEPKVLFRPFTGVAPTLYRRAFLKDQSLKEKSTGDMRISPPSWGGSLALRQVSYIELEMKVSNEE